MCYTPMQIINFLDHPSMVNTTMHNPKAHANRTSEELVLILLSPDAADLEVGALASGA